MVAEHGAVPRLPAWRLREPPSQMVRTEPATPTATVASPLPVPTGATLTTAYAERLEALAHAVSATGAVGAHSVNASAGTPPGLPPNTTNAALSTGNQDQMLLSQMATAQSPSPVMDGLMAAAETTSTAVQNQGLAGLNKSTAASATANAAAATLRALCQRRAPAREPLNTDTPAGS